MATSFYPKRKYVFSANQKDYSKFSFSNLHHYIHKVYYSILNRIRTLPFYHIPNHLSFTKTMK